MRQALLRSLRLKSECLDNMRASTSQNAFMLKRALIAAGQLRRAVRPFRRTADAGRHSV
jgi:hypothetical protein